MGLSHPVVSIRTESRVTLVNSRPCHSKETLMFCTCFWLEEIFFFIMDSFVESSTIFQLSVFQAVDEVADKETKQTLN